jgi:hypothetical protein
MFNPFRDGLDLFFFKKSALCKMKPVFFSQIGTFETSFIEFLPILGLTLRLGVVTKLIEHEKHTMLITGRLIVKFAKFLLVFVVGIANRNQCCLAKIYL